VTRPPRQAMVLAAGVGLRMRPLSEGRAKPALPLMNRPLLLHLLDSLDRQGIENAVVNLHHEPGSLREVLEAASFRKMKVTTTFEPEILGTGGGIRGALRHLDREATLLVANADSLGDVDLGALAEAHAGAATSFGAPATLAVKGRETGEPYAAVHLDARSRLSGIGDVGERGEPATFIGLHLLEPEAIGRIPDAVPSDIVRHVYLPLLGEGRRLGAYRHRGWWIETGTPALYLRSHIRLLREAAFLAALPPACGSPLPDSPPSWIGPGCEGIGRSSVVESVLGPGCVLGSGARVVRSVLAAGVRVGAGAVVEDSVVWENVGVPGGASIRASLLTRPAPGGDGFRQEGLS
jgi:mannose-1-phosphate guanylyltransferase